MLPSALFRSLSAAPKALLVLLLATGLACSGVAEPSIPAGDTAFSPPTPALKRQMLRQVNKCLKKRAFVYGVDFGRWPEIVEGYRGDIDASTTDDELAAGFNRALAEFGVSHLKVTTPGEEASKKDGRTIGAGIKVVPVAEGQLVALVLPESPAAQAGMVKGDLVTHVDGVPVGGGEDFPGLIDYRLQGAPGLTKVLRWQREGAEGPATFEETIGYAAHPVGLPTTLEWKTVPPPAPESEASEIAWLTLNSFREEVYDRQQVAELFSQIRSRADGLVIDLRGNSGGLFNNVVHLASFLVPAGEVGGVVTERKDYQRRHKALQQDGLSTEERIQALGDPFKIGWKNVDETYDGPLVVLIDGASGSGGDLFPAIVDGARDAVLVGSTTHGALLGGVSCGLAGGFDLTVPIQEILGPKGERIEGVGTPPDVELTPRQTVDDAGIEEVALGIFGVQFQQSVALGV
ncbi:MAG: S41 family peptidase [Acidobacteriota bacterium]|nr:S41 family peptidase [Acidobacteriota bacterium]